MFPPPTVKPAAPLGKGMLIAAWLCALALLTFAFGKWQQQRDHPNREVAGLVTDEEIIVTLRRNPAGPYSAAGRIHGDFEKGLVRAEIIAYADYIACGGEQQAKDAGKWRLEGRDYVMQEGDVVHFRFTV